MSLGNTYSYPDRNEQTLTMRPAHGALFLVNSDDRYQLDVNNTINNQNAINPNNFQINRQKLFGAGPIKRYALTEINFPWTTPNVNVNNNKLLMYLTVVGGAGPVPVYVPILIEAFYTPTSLASALQSQLNDGSATGGFYNFIDNSHFGNGGVTDWTVVFNQTTQTFTIAEPSNTLIFSVLVNNENLQYFSPMPAKTLNELMGFDYGGTQPVLSGSQTSGIPNMAYTRYIDIVSQTLSKYQATKDAQTQYNYADVIYRLYLDNNISLNGVNGTNLNVTNYFGCAPCININKQIQNPKFIEWTGDEYLNNIDIKLYDDNGQPLYIPTKNWSSNFLLTFLMLDS
jgi:hypothetical protein